MQEFEANPNKKAIVIYNPTSGKKSFQGKMSDCVEILSQAGFVVEIHPTKHRGDAAIIAEKSCDWHCSLLVAVGGDGTLNEVVNGLAKLAKEQRPVLAHIPAGTSNDFASTIGMPANIKKASDIIVNGTIVDLDIGKSNEKYFTYITATGAFTRLTYTTPSKLKRLLGISAYLLNFFKELPLINRPFKLRIDVDGKLIEGDYTIALIINSKNFAGLRDVFPNIQLNDGVFDILLFPKSSPKVLAGALRSMAFGVDHKLSNFGITHIKGSKINIEAAKKITWNIDGEKGTGGSVKLECLKQYLKIIVPPETKLKHFNS